MLALTIASASLLTGCAGVSQQFQQSLEFESPVAQVDVPFEVVDRRDNARKDFRHLDGSAATFQYGDDQFSPHRIRFVASHFAAAIPRAPEETRLVIDQFDIVNYMPRPMGDVKGGYVSGVEGIIVALFYLLGKAIQSADTNQISCRLRGSFGGIPFEATHYTPYDDPSSTGEIRRAIRAAMLSVTTKAIAEVRRSAPARWSY